MSKLKTLSVLSLVALVAACSTPPAPSNAPIAGVPRPVSAAQGADALAAPASPRGVAGSGGADGSALASGNSAGNATSRAVASTAAPDGRSVYFDFDEFAIKPEYVQLVEAHGSWLAANPAVAIKVEGNADERGGREYNLALGQKRADAVARALRTQGVKETQVEAISWGKDKPRATGHDETAWAENRRADLAYPSR